MSDDAPSVEVIELPEGPMGKPGVRSGLIRYPVTAVLGQCVLKDNGDGVHAVPADPTIDTTGDLILGVSASAAQPDDIVTIQTDGDMVELSWSWAIGPVYCGAAGALVQTPPAGFWSRQIGVAVSPTQIVISIQPTIYTP